MSKRHWRLIATAILVIIACVAFWNTFRLWTMDDAAKAAMDDREPGALLRLQQKAIRLGLDLQGGIHVVLRVKTEELDRGSRDEAVDRAMQIIRNRVDGLGVAEPVIIKQGTDRIIVDLPGYTDPERAEELIGQTALLEFKLMETFENASLLLTKIDSVIHKIEQAKKGIVPANTAVSPSLAEKTTDSSIQSDDILKELMGDSAVDTSKLFAFDEESDLSEDEHPLSTRLDPMLVSSRSNTNWPGFAVAKKDRELLSKWLS
ncbi:MAG TPA: hypothetical protein VN285_08890, partial [Candidatus Deferrimicrobium sp.]|nr:hypothetical protein [Candidatus Deferrimicrobium sp.]